MSKERLALSVESDRWLAPGQLLLSQILLRRAISLNERTFQLAVNSTEAAQPCARSRHTQHTQTALASLRALCGSNTNYCLVAPSPFCATPYSLAPFVEYHRKRFISLRVEISWRAFMLSKGERFGCHEFGPKPQNASSEGVARVSKGKWPTDFE